MTTVKHIALVGDFNPDVLAHQAIPKALELAALTTSLACDFQWLGTETLGDDALLGFDGLWCVPASPYKNMAAVLAAIRFARENNLPFLGTCGGYQHATLEFARNVLGHSDAANAEVDSDAAMPLISALQCKLVEKTDRINFLPGSAVAQLYGAQTADEDYHCSFGVNRLYLPLFEGSDLCFSGFDRDGDVRVLELAGHCFFIGTAYQPERAALAGHSHPLVEAFLRATL